jgi:hypothetical protein
MTKALKHFWRTVRRSSVRALLCALIVALVIHHLFDVVFLFFAGAENCLFWSAVNSFKLHPTLALAQQIESMFLADDAPLQVNLSHQIKNNLHRALSAYQRSPPPPAPIQIAMMLPPPPLETSSSDAGSSGAPEIALPASPVLPFHAKSSTFAAIDPQSMQPPQPRLSVPLISSITAASGGNAHRQTTMSSVVPGSPTTGPALAPPVPRDSLSLLVSSSTATALALPSPSSAPAPSYSPDEFPRVFDAAQREIFRLLESDSFARFKANEAVSKPWAHFWNIPGLKPPASPR